MAILTYNGRPLDYGDAVPPFNLQPNGWGFPVYGAYVWHDQEGRCFYTSGGAHKVLIGTSWSDVTYTNAPSSVGGEDVWCDGTHLLYAYGNNKQYGITVLDGGTTLKFTSYNNWNGYTSIYGRGIWYDGSNYYYDGNSLHVRLDYATWTAYKKDWGQYKPLSGQYVWDDGVTYYYSEGSTQYVLNQAHDTWSLKTWYGLSSFDGNNVWKLGSNVYYSYNGTHYMLNKSTSTWEQIYPGVSFDGKYVWSDNGDTYVTDYKIIDNGISGYNFISYETT